MQTIKYIFTDVNNYISAIQYTTYRSKLQMHTLNGIKYSLPGSIRIPGEIRILPLQVVRVLVWLAGPTVKEATPETGEHILGSQLNCTGDSLLGL